MISWAEKGTVNIWENGEKLFWVFQGEKRFISKVAQYHGRSFKKKLRNGLSTMTDMVNVNVTALFIILEEDI